MNKLLLGGFIILYVISYYFFNHEQTYKNNLEINLSDKNNILIELKSNQHQKPVNNLKIVHKPSHSSSTVTQPDKIYKNDTITEKEIDFKKFIEKIPDGNILQYVNTKHKNENVDQSWSSEQELFLYDYFENTADLNNFIPQSIECKSTLCKIVIPVVDNNEQYNASIKISEALQKDSNIISTHAIFDSTTHQLNIFIPKSNNFFY